MFVLILFVNKSFPMFRVLPLIGLLLLLLPFGCGEADSGTTIDVHLENAAGLSANFDRIVIGGEKEMLKSSPIDQSGDFSFVFPQGLKPGLYEVRVGAQKATFALAASDRDIKIDGKVSTFGQYDFTVSGSAAASESVATMLRIKNLSGLEEFKTVVDEVENPYTAAFVTFNALLRAGEQGVPLHEAAMERLPESPSRESYNDYLTQLKQQIAMLKSQAQIQVGQPAPELSLPGPDGKSYSLSDLKGQVVLLDFWAAWCVPCRRENPNVVKVYNRYKDKGFTIFSVSLDGLDDSQAARLTPEQLEIATDNQRERWQQAIAQDGLTWKNHGSELKKWSGDASAKYGVRGIPATFLIDREGNIAEIGLRGATAIEQALQRVL